MLRHVKWFTDPGPFPTQYDQLFSLPVLLAFAVALAALGVAYWIQHTIPEPPAARLFERYAGRGPAVLGIVVGAALLIAAFSGILFVPSLRVDQKGALGFAILVLEGVAGVSLLLGLATRAGAVVLVVLGVIAMYPFSLEAILEQVHVLGVAVFLFLIGRGPWSLDRVRRVRPPVDHPLVPTAALTALRLLMGFGIAYVALTEKLLNAPLSRSLLEGYPVIALNRFVGLPDDVFIWLAGTVELTVGILVMSGQITRPVMAIGAVLFSVTLLEFGWPELLGHLPFLGIMAVLFIAPNADAWHLRRALRPAA